jgi:septation ring formation regulator EzrA
MGAWDTSSFGNDTANDWAYGLEDCADLSLIESTLQTVAEAGDEYIEATEGEEAIAAAEVLAWLRGQGPPLNAYTEKVASWVEAHPITPPAELVQLALAVLDRLQQEPSELMELWEDDAEWQASVADLRARLSQDPA